MESINKLNLSVSSALGNLVLIRGLARTYLEHQSVEKKDMMLLLSVIDELATNAVEHGYEYSPGTIEISMDFKDEEVNLSIEDYGNGYGVGEVKGEDRGMGLFLVKSIADRFKIEKKETGTKFFVSKRIEEAK